MDDFCLSMEGTSGFNPIDSLSSRGKALFVFGHDVVRSLFGLVKIKGDIAELETLCGKLVE